MQMCEPRQITFGKRFLTPRAGSQEGAENTRRADTSEVRFC